MKRKEQLLIYSLGRETTPYEAAKRFGRSHVITSSEYGAWYSCKKKLLEEKLITERNVSERKKPIRANVLRYLNLTLRGIPNEENFEREIAPIFEKYAPKIVSFLIEKKLLSKPRESEIYDQSYPVVFFLLARYMAAFVNAIKPLPSDTAIGKVYSFVKGLSNDERKELSVSREQQEQNLEVAFTLLPHQLFKEVYMDMGTRVFAEILFRKEQIDWLIREIALGPEERLQFLREQIEKWERRQDLEARKRELDENREIMRNHESEK